MCKAKNQCNPELLDWLATEFIRSGWDVKQLCELIVTSATYRQTSRATSGPDRTRSAEPFARAWHPVSACPRGCCAIRRSPPSGLLVDKVGGEPRQSVPAFGRLGRSDVRRQEVSAGHGEALYRRSLYTFWRRIVAPTLFFDSASRQTCTVKQPRTNTPLQALTTLNDVTYVEAARVLAERVMAETAEEPEARIELAFRRILARKPSTEEIKLLADALNRYEKQFQADPGAAQRFLSVGESKRDEKLPDTTHAAYAMLCSTLMNLDEALRRNEIEKFKAKVQSSKEVPNYNSEAPKTLVSALTWWEDMEREVEVSSVGLMLREDEPSADQRPPWNLEERVTIFGEKIVRFSKKIPRNPTNDRLISQLVGAGTSTGANYCEANEAVSVKDFKCTVGRCLKEAKETKFFLRMVVASESQLAEQARPLYREAHELLRIFGSMRKR